MRGILLRQTLRTRSFLQRVQRFQHTGPHKEYFQNPSQFPAASVPHYAPPPQPTFPTQPSVLRRLTRSAFWAVSFSLLGILAGTAAITYEYLQPLFEVGSEEELEELEGIKEIISSHPLVDALSQDENWKEQAMYMEDRDWDQDKDFHFLSRKTLKGANGISMAFFSNIQSGMSCLIFFPGSGVEGWPDVTHGGIICALLQEAMEQTASFYHSPAFGQQRAELEKLEVNFRVPLQVGNVYAIFAFVDFGELNVPGGMGTPLGSSQRSTGKVHALLMETAVLDWQDNKDAAIIHASAIGKLKDPVFMSQKDYAIEEVESTSASQPS